MKVWVITSGSGFSFYGVASSLNSAIESIRKRRNYSCERATIRMLTPEHYTLEFQNDVLTFDIALYKVAE